MDINSTNNITIQKDNNQNNLQKKVNLLKELINLRYDLKQAPTENKSDESSTNLKIHKKFMEFLKNNFFNLIYKYLTGKSLITTEANSEEVDLNKGFSQN